MALRMAVAAAGRGSARTLHALPDGGNAVAQLLLHPSECTAGSVHRSGELPAAHRRRDLLAGAQQQSLVCRRHHSVVDRARASDGGMGQRQHRWSRLSPARVLHADRAADDRGGEHLALFLYAGVRFARENDCRVRALDAQLAGEQKHRAGGVDGGRRLEGSWLLHDFLPGGAAADVAPSRRSGGDRGRFPLVFLSPRYLSPPDANDAVRPGQCGHQRVPSGRSHRGDDARRSRQRYRAAALLHLRDRISFLGSRLRRRADDDPARAPRRRRTGTVLVSRTQGALPVNAALHGRSGLGESLETIAAWLLGALWILPLAYAVWTAFHPGEFSTHFSLSAPLTLENFVRAWHAAPFARYFMNTIALCAMILAAQLVLCTLAAYAFARFEFPGRSVLFALVLVQLMIMPDVLIVENYRTMSALGLRDTIVAIGLPDMASAFGIFLLRQTFKTVPRELDESARVEGCTPLQLLWKVYVPLARPVYLAYALVSVSYHWNNFLWPLIITNSVESRPLTVGLQVFSATDQGIDWSIITAATLPTSAPLLAAVLLSQRQFVQSFMRAGIK